MTAIEPPTPVPLGDPDWDAKVTPAGHYYAFRRPLTELTDAQREAGLSPVVSGPSLRVLKERIEAQKTIEGQRMRLVRVHASREEAALFTPWTCYG